MTTYAAAITEVLLARMASDPRTIILGVGVGDSRYGGKDAYGSLAPITAAYPACVIDTPLSETMLTNALVGLAAEGWHPVMVHLRADFIYLSGDGLLNTAATWRMIHGTPCPITVKAVIGEGFGCGPMHSKAPLEMFNVPGLDMFTPRSHYGLKRAYNNALVTGNPTVIFERRRDYGVDIDDPDSMWRELADIESPVDWTIPRGPAPASAPLEKAYYEGNVVAPTGGPF